MKREFSAGGIVYKTVNGLEFNVQGNAGGVLWLIRKPKAGHGYRGKIGWCFPKGLIEEKSKIQSPKSKKDKIESLEETALREVEEEGGVKAKIIAKLPTQKFMFKDKDNEWVMKFVTYFLMEWQKDLKQGFGWETEEAKWVSFEEAKKLLIYKNDKELLDKAASLLTQI